LQFLKTFQAKIIFYLALLLAVLTGVALSLIYREYLFVLVVLLPVAVGLVYTLFKLVDKTNTDLVQLLLSIRYDDFEQQFTPDQLGESHQHLYQSFNVIIDKYKDLRSEKEIQHQIMQTIIEQVDTGIFCTDENGKCLMVNAALKQLLHKSYIADFEDLKTVVPNLYPVLKNIKPGERETVKEVIQNEMLQIAVQVFLLKIKEETIKVYTFYNIHNELSDQEVKSWQKLIRILAHEIMNSIAPIASISNSVLQMIGTDKTLTADESAEIKEAFQIIQKRSESLMNFTETYRKLTRIPPPKLELFNVRTFLEGVKKLFEQDLKQKGISLKFNFLLSEIKLLADPVLLEQVFINLFKNAIDALEGVAHPEIVILVDKSPQGKVHFQIMDNGKGIPADVVDQIFVPFFTTKENGSGIGLSLSQQIIQMHGGNIHLQSEVGVGTVVSFGL
jgi:two-component system, NtrC family, nitrogen regulation sensor histidine kinase NtrY